MEEIQMVPLAAYEAQAERCVRTVKYMSAGWVVTVLALIFVMLSIIFYAEVETEAVETTETITQDSGDGGINAYAGGDFNGSANNYQNGKDNQDD